MSNHYVEILPDRVEAEQWRKLCERLVSALIWNSQSYDDEQLIAEAKAKLGTDPPAPVCDCDEWVHGWSGGHYG